MATTLPLPPAVALCKERTRHISIDIPETDLTAAPAVTLRWERQVCTYDDTGKVLTAEVKKRRSLSGANLLGRPGVADLYIAIAAKLDEIDAAIDAEEAAAQQAQEA
jgi:hypothetical protein